MYLIFLPIRIMTFVFCTRSPILPQGIKGRKLRAWLRSARNKAGLAIKRWAKTLLARRSKVWLLFSFDTYYVVPTHFLQLQLPTADDEFLPYMQRMKSGMSSEAYQAFGRHIVRLLAARFAPLDQDSASGAVVDTRQVTIISLSL
jgi:hypothetical protein